MFKLLPKIFLSLIFWVIFAFVIFKIPYPNSLTDSTAFQLFGFFISLFLALTFTINIFLSFLLLSSILGLSVIFLLILKALGSLNFVTVSIVLLAVYLLYSYFKKQKRLTKEGGMPKLHSLRRKRR